MSKQRTITLTGRRPVKINEAAWPIIASGKAYSGQYEFQAFDGAWIKVRQHSDGRTIVYGYAGDWDGGGRPTRENLRGGYLLDPGADIAASVRNVANDIGSASCCDGYAEAAARECVADLPAEEL